MPPTPEQWAQIDAAMDRKIEAIRLYRHFTNADLRTAKDAIEARERGGVLPASDDSSAVNWTPIDDLLQGRQLIQAIKLYREQTGVSLKEAKDAVEQRRAQRGITATSSAGGSRGIGCGLVVVLILIAAAGVAVLSFLR